MWPWRNFKVGSSTQCSLWLSGWIPAAINTLAAYVIPLDTVNLRQEAARNQGAETMAPQVPDTQVTLEENTRACLM